MKQKKTDTIKSNEILIFIFGWIASFFAVAVPIMLVSYINTNTPTISADYKDRITILSYLAGAFFSGLFTTYRVYRKGKEKDSEISQLTQENNELKNAYQAISPKKKIIIKILTELYKKSHDMSKGQILSLLIKKIEEINEDSAMDSSWEGMINYLKNHAQFNEFNQPVAMNSAQQEIGRKSEFTYNKNGQSFEIKFNNEKNK
ncbi:hypothetical protein WN53_03460 [Serratia fonticola]|uniref:hypothetical protein n=2 Tax=Serratia fonticola TaxID=47917 RepID=UPI000629E3A8|nr:hypothetical protein [Serratia fonticola]AKG68260.1 hypothetical protein WN53_03460 [Serratia fonticola]